jgi:hypothetical protein
MSSRPPARFNNRAAAALLDLRRHRFERRLIAPVQDDVATFVRECKGDGAPNPAARPGDERDLPTQRKLHDATPFLSPTH